MVETETWKITACGMIDPSGGSLLGYLLMLTHLADYFWHASCRLFLACMMIYVYIQPRHRPRGQ